MEIDIADPVGIAQQIAAHVADEIERLRELLRLLLPEETLNSTGVWIMASPYYRQWHKPEVLQRVREALGDE
jgi:hypothetical protein